MTPDQVNQILYEMKRQADEVRLLSFKVDAIIRSLEGATSAAGFEKAETVARLLEADPHSFSTRPCQTCQSASSLLGRPYGCVAKARRSYQ